MFPRLFDKLARHEDLDVAEASEAMGAIMDGAATPAQIAGLLIGLRLKGERPGEIVGLARAMRQRSVKLPEPVADVFDTCGTGGDGGGTFNVSTASALVVAACGVAVAKHGNRAISSRCGSADVLEALGVNAAAPPDVVARCLQGAGIGFCFAPVFHPSMKRAAEPRRELGIRTAFNLLGPLTNPAGATRQIVGVPRPEFTELVARALAMLGSTRAWVVHGSDGMDEISTLGYTKVSECHGDVVHTFYVHPSDFDLPKGDRSQLAGGDAAFNAARIRAVLAGERGAARDIVVLNAGAALLVSGRVASVKAGVGLAAEAIDSGRAAATLARLAALSTEKMPA
ncbi:MAG: anthranilate phosphoribosyltransferase [Vicinamibacterales bacterium]